MWSEIIGRNLGIFNLLKGFYGSVHLQNLIILILIILILKMSLPIFGDKSVGAGGLWLSHTCPSQCSRVLKFFHNEKKN